MGEDFRPPVRFPGKADKAAPYDGFFVPYPTFLTMPPDCSDGLGPRYSVVSPIVRLSVP
jgi:hypothetical protein